ncbi:MAG: hypothetical protein A2W91_19595 [Bacteroidetes bacterium GWF2_38_335]|nr:MAG: hypothetical protein A2W91_19595 [Bacteroidetes bacterium GWF2_38_335]OFY79961.1 MAG: hypothetical protein A2281_10995 [Bacteroidetes bacterium RIFOXYA12_FULL_38_20]HBS86420.1 hypothetical protein [Bacteroidales bacterium]
MKVNTNDVILEMLAVIKGTVSDHWDEVKTTTNQFLQRRKVRLELLAEMLEKGEITPARFKSRLEDEKLLLEAELNAMAVISKAIAQKAANAAIDVFEKAILAAISTI